MQCYSCYIIDSETDKVIGEFCSSDYEKAENQGEEYIRIKKLNAYTIMLDTTEKYI